MRKRKYAIVALEACLIFICAASKDANRVTIRGVVKLDLAPLGVDCSAKISVPGHVVHTGKDGTFVLKDISPGTVTITVSRSGYRSEQQSVLVTAGKEVNIALTLYPLEIKGVGNINVDIPP